MRNLRSRELAAEIMGRKRPLYEGKLLDRDIHISDFELPEDTLWGGKKLSELQFRNRYGIHVSSILRGKQRINIPNGETVVFPGDKIQAIGSDEQLTNFSTAMKNELYERDLEIEKREMKLHQIVISKDGLFVGKTLKDSGIRDKYNCMIVGVEEGRETLSLFDPSRVLCENDILWIVGEQDDVDRVNKDNNQNSKS